MPNPLLGGFRRQVPQQQTPPQNQGGVFDVINKVRSSPDPDAAMQQLLASNPGFQNVMSYIQANGGDAKTAFYNLAAQKGVDPNSILKQLR